MRYGYRAPDKSTLASLYTDRTKGFGAVVKERILIGNYVLSAGHADQYYNKAKRVQAKMRHELLQAFEKVDLLFGPVSPVPAFPFGTVTGLELDLQDYFTAVANLTGIPAIAVPCGFTPAGLPIGFQLLRPDFSEELLYQAAYAYEQANPWHLRHPPGYTAVAEPATAGNELQ